MEKKAIIIEASKDEFDLSIVEFEDLENILEALLLTRKVISGYSFEHSNIIELSGLCLIYDSFLSFHNGEDRFRYQYIFRKMLPPQVYNRLGVLIISNRYLTGYSFPIYKEGKDEIEQFYHHRIKWLNETINKIENELQRTNKRKY